MGGRARQRRRGGRPLGPERLSAPALFDRALLRQRRARAAAGYQDFAFLRAEIVDRMMERLDAVARRFPVAVELGARDRLLADALAARGRVDWLARCDGVAPAGRPACVVDEEAPPFGPARLDACFGALGLSWVNDLPGALAQIRRALKPDGLFLAALAGGETLSELREAALQAEMELYGGASPRVSPTLPLQEAAGLLQRAGFALPVADLDRLTIDYADVFGLLRDLRGMGATNALVERARRPVGRAFFARLAAIYAERFSRADGRVTARVDIIWLTGWAPAAGQQKPLRPGAATASLADALGAQDRAPRETPD